MKTKIYGYCRISKKSQSIDRQIRNIKDKHPTAIIIQEAYTGTKLQGRKQFEKLLSMVQEGDTIVFDSVSRMSRNADDGTKLYFELFDKGINLVFLKEGYINTDVYKNSINNQLSLVGNEIADEYIKATNKVIKILAEKQIKIAFDQAEKEVMDLRQRTSEGMLTAKLNGARIGNEKGCKLTTKKSIESKKLIEKYSKDFNGSLSDAEVIKLIDISRNSYYKYKRELKDNKVTE